MASEVKLEQPTETTTSSTRDDVVNGGKFAGVSIDQQDEEEAHRTWNGARIREVSLNIYF